MIGPESQELSQDSRSAAYLKANRLISQLHQRSTSDVAALLRDLVVLATQVVPGAQYAGITVGQRRQLAETASATHRYPVLLDEIQNRLRQGPSLTAAAEQQTVLVDDLADDHRWPLFGQETLDQTPIRSILSLPMLTEGSTSATLNFYAETTAAFVGGSVDLGLVFATSVALVWNMTRREQQFRAALVSRDVIGQAKGRMMERLDIDAGEAFEMIRLASQESNTPVARVAQSIVAGEVWPFVE